ncbi:MAG: hypothetical protein C5B51_13615 [Terriglobia bacterium]|nr:MAG: hypothetical protein C5B51_13615 [Terriglobia bacterium]
MELTGNPFVDHGLSVMSYLAGCPDVSGLTRKHIADLVGDATALAHVNSRLKSFALVFGPNGPLTQPAYRKSGSNEAIYKKTVELLARAVEEDSTGEPCEITGMPTSFDFQSLCRTAIESAGLRAPEKKWIGRDWFPLAGSMGNDAQALPAASRPLHVSALALLAMQYLPLGMRLLQGRLMCIQGAWYPLVHELIVTTVEQNREALSAGADILGKGPASSAEFVDFLLAVFGKLLRLARLKAPPPNTTLDLWLFKNAKEADCEIMPIPDPALRFLWDAQSQEFRPEIRKLLANEPKNPRYQLLACIRDGRDYSGLYPYKKWPGASREFFEFYQTRICGKTDLTLATARAVTKQVRLVVDGRRLANLTKSDSLSGQARKPNRATLRRVIADILPLGVYDALFPSQWHPIRIDSSGWKLLQFYLATKPCEKAQIPPEALMKTTHPKITLIGDEYVRTRSPRRVKDVLDRLARGKLGVRWLQDQFCAMAEKYPEFEFGDWDEFACGEDGRPIVGELLFQIRLHLANRYRHSVAQAKETNA